jgi:hypothetical protein
MTQIQQLGFLANNLTVNTAANTATITNALVVGNSSVNVVINSSSVYVSGAALGSGGSTNVAAQYAWTNTHTFAANLTISNTSELIISSNAGIYANGSLGTAGQVLTTNATTVYWSTAGGGFTNGQSIMVSNVAFSNSSNTASAYTFYNTTTASLDTVFV